MSVQLVLKNSSVQDKEATAAQLAVGELALNYHSSGPFLQCEDSAGNIWRLGGVVIASTAPTSPSKGAWWLDSDDNSLHFYDGSSWISIQTGETAPGDITEGTARQLLQTNAAGTDTEWTSDIDVPGTLDVTGVATFDNNVVITGNLTVNGTTTTIDTTTLVVEDKNIELGVVGTPTDTTADGGGITVKGATDKTLTWVNSTGMWTSNQPLDVAGEVQCDSLDVDGAADIAGTLTTNRLIVDDDGSASPTAVFKADDQGPWAVCIKNDTYSTDENVGLKIYQSNGGGVTFQNRGDSAYTALYLNQDNGTTSRQLLQGGSNGEVTLYYQGNAKLATQSTGIDVTGSVTCDGLTSEGDTTISAGTGSLIIKDSNTSGDAAEAFIRGRDSADANKWYVGSGSTADMYIHNYKNGDIVFGTNNAYRALFTESGHFIPYYDDQSDLGSSSNEWRNAYFDGTVHCDQLDVDGTIDIAGNASFFGNVDLQDNDRLRLGSGDDLQIYHDGSTSTIANSTGDLVVQTTGAGDDVVIQAEDDVVIQVQRDTGAENAIVCHGDGSVFLYHNNATKLTTTSSGINVTGSVTCDGFTSDGASQINVSNGCLTLRDSDSAGNAATNFVRGQDSGGDQKWYVGDINGTGDVYLWNQQSGYVYIGTNNSTVLAIQNNNVVRPGANNTIDLGTSSYQFKDAYFDGTVFTDGLEVTATANLSSKVYSTERTATASSFDLATGNFWTFGAIAVPNPANQTAGMMGSLRVTAAPTSFASNWKFPGGSYTAPTSFPAVAPFFVQASGTILVGSWTEGIA